MIRTEGDLRAVYTEPPGLDEAEARILDALTTQPLADSNRRRVPPRTWLAIAATAAAVIGIVVAAGAVVGHRAEPGSGPIVPGPYRYVRTHSTTGEKTGVIRDNGAMESWTAADGHLWGRGGGYQYTQQDLTSRLYSWSAGFLLGLPTDWHDVRRYVLANGDAYDKQQLGENYPFIAVFGFWKMDTERFQSAKAMQAVVQMLEHTEGAKTTHGRDPLGRPSVRLDLRAKDHDLYTMWFAEKTYSYLGQQATDAKGRWDRTIVEANQDVNAVPKAVVDAAHKAYRRDHLDDNDKPKPWAQPVTY